MFMDYVFYVLFFALPFLTVGFFGISLFRYLCAKKANKKNPSHYGRVCYDCYWRDCAFVYGDRLYVRRR